MPAKAKSICRTLADLIRQVWEENAIVLEAISKMALLTFLLDSPRRSLGGRRPGISKVLLDKHYLRKHGKTAYYGQA